MAAFDRGVLCCALVLLLALSSAASTRGKQYRASYVLSAYPRPHLTNTPPSMDSVKIPKEMTDIRLTIAGPQPSSPLRNSSLDSVASVLREGAQLVWFRVPSKWQVLELASKAADALKFRDLFWTFASPSALRRIVSTQRVTFTVKYRRQGHGGTDEGPITIFAIDPASPSTRRVVCPKESATFVPASWKRWWQGEELTVSWLPDSTIVEQCVATVPAVCSTDFHLQREVSNVRDLFSTDEPLPAVDVLLSVIVTEALDLRMMMVGLIVGAFLVVGQRLSHAPISQLFVGFVFGPVALLIGLITVLVRPVIPRSWVGRSLVFGFVFSGCLSSISVESFTPGRWISEIPKDTINPMMLGYACASLLTAILIRWTLPEYLAAGTRLTVRAVECAFALWFSWANPEVVTLVGLVAPIAYMWLTRHESSEELVMNHRSAPRHHHEEPQDRLPQSAYFAKEFVPTKAQRFHSCAPETKFELYAKEGDDYTRRELEKLADTVRKDSTFSKLVRNPNELYRFAGEPCPVRCGYLARTT